MYSEIDLRASCASSSAFRVWGERSWVAREGQDRDRRSRLYKGLRGRGASGGFELGLAEFLGEEGEGGADEDEGEDADFAAVGVGGLRMGGHGGMVVGGRGKKKEAARKEGRDPCSRVTH